jgi:hypothetical protein
MPSVLDVMEPYDDSCGFYHGFDLRNQVTICQRFKRESVQKNQSEFFRPWLALTKGTWRK